MKLNNEQEQAVLHKDDACMVIAGPGAGKTAVITTRVAYLIEQYQITPSSILVATFTKAAAKEMKERFLHMTKKRSTEVTFGTFHGVFFGILKQAYNINASNILGEEEKYDIIRNIISHTELTIEDEGDFIAMLIQEISVVKNNRIELEYFHSTCCADDLFRQIYNEYQQTLRQRRRLDFDDMMVYCYELFTKRSDILARWQDKFKYLLVDEFQDINKIQYDIVRMLAAPLNNLFVVGDDDQSIYRFRGARPEIMLQFPKDYKGAKVIVLNHNYRCTKNILGAAQQVIRENKVRYEKQLLTDNQGGDALEIKEFKTSREQSLYTLKQIQKYLNEGYEFNDIAILFRTNMGSRMSVNLLMEYEIPFILKDRLPNLFEHWIARNMIAYLRFAMGEHLRRDFLMIMNRPNRYISREAVYERIVSFEELYKFYEDKTWMCERLELFESQLNQVNKMPPFAAINYIRHGIGYEQYLKEYAQFRKLKVEELYEVLDELQETAKPFKTAAEWFDFIEAYKVNLEKQNKEQQAQDVGIVLSTLHSAKGLEYKKVFLLDVNEGVIPYHKATLNENIEEERRLFYVGMTRAKENLHIYYTQKRFDKELVPSRFIKGLK
jgi:Superfamily I DNA and RNA helicases